MPNLVKSINLTDDDKATLESILHQSTIEARTYIRAKILLLKSECRSNESIADKLNICVTAVRLCIDKYNTGGIEVALQDNKGRGCKAKIIDADIIWVINKVCQKLKNFGYSAELWYQFYTLYQFRCRAGRASPYGVCDRNNAAQDIVKCKDPSF